MLSVSHYSSPLGVGGCFSIITAPCKKLEGSICKQPSHLLCLTHLIRCSGLSGDVWSQGRLTLCLIISTSQRHYQKRIPRKSHENTDFNNLFPRLHPSIHVMAKIQGKSPLLRGLLYRGSPLKGRGKSCHCGTSTDEPGVICQILTHSNYFSNILGLAKCILLSPLSQHFYTHVYFKGNLICMFLIHLGITRHNCSVRITLCPRIFPNLLFHKPF